MFLRKPGLMERLSPLKGEVIPSPHAMQSMNNHLKGKISQRVSLGESLYPRSCNIYGKKEDKCSSASQDVPMTLQTHGIEEEWCLLMVLWCGGPTNSSWALRYIIFNFPRPIWDGFMPVWRWFRAWIYRKISPKIIFFQHFAFLTSFESFSQLRKS